MMLFLMVVVIAFMLVAWGFAYILFRFFLLAIPFLFVAWMVLLVISALLN